jgi:hypothetical protein
MQASGRLFCLSLVQYLKNLQIYGYGKPDDFIFHLGYRSHAGRIQKIREESGIQKPFTCHKLRHAAATELVLQGVQEGIIKKKMGWSPSSPMIARYTHTNDDAVIQATLKLQGKERDARKPIEIKQPEKLSLQDAAGHMFKLEEENSDLKLRMEKQTSDIETMKAQMSNLMNYIKADLTNGIGSDANKELKNYVEEGPKKIAEGNFKVN